MADDIAPQILREIRDEIRGLRSDTAELRADTNARFDRLTDEVSGLRAVIDHAWIDIRSDQADLRRRVGALEQRLQQD